MPPSVQFQEKRRLGLTLLRCARAAGLQFIAAVGDAEYWEPGAFRGAVDRLRLPYALGIRKTLTVFVGTPRTIHIPPSSGGGRPRTRLPLAPGEGPITVGALAQQLPAKHWRHVLWRNGTNPPLAAEFVALRVTPAAHWHRTQPLETVWLLCAPRWRHNSHEVLPEQLAARRRASLRSCGWPIRDGRSSSITKTSKPNSASITSKAAVTHAVINTW